MRKYCIALALGAICTALFGPAKRGIEALVDRLLYKDRYDYRQIINSLATSLNSLNEITDLARLTVGTAVNTLRLDGGCLFLESQSGSFELRACQGKFLDLNKQKIFLNLISELDYSRVFPNQALKLDPDLAFIIPLTAAEKTIGFLCLSRKTSRQQYSSNDIYLIQEIALVSASALRSAMLVRDVSVRDTFVSIASHELRTPLTPIMGFADLILKTDPSPEVRNNWLKIIIDNSNKISRMVDEMLNVTRIQSGKVSFKIEPVAITRIDQGSGEYLKRNK